MRIGLLTYHNSTNYGAVLQCYATCRILKELGHEVELINIIQYEPKVSRSFIFYYKVKAFKRFMTHFYPPKTILYTNIEQLKNANFNYDCLMVGSDQVWNPYISREHCESYFLNFASKHIKRISYASSIGLSEWPHNKRHLLPNIDKALHSFNFISVRENTAKLLLKKLFNVESKVVLDPTLLHEDYKEITNTITPNNSFICYLLNKTNKQLEKTRMLASIFKKKPQMISTIRPIKGFKYTYPPSIENWINYIAGADFVVTDSFHGVAFSIIYRKNFVVISPENGKNSRITNLLSLLGLNSRYFNENEDIPYNLLYHTHIDYDKVNYILNKEREYSLTFLKTALNNGIK